MLNIIFNRGTKDIDNKNYVFSPDTYFKYNYENEWFDDEFVKKIIWDVDGSTVESAHSIDSPVLGIIAPERLSGKAGPGTEVQCDRKCIVLSGDSDNAITLLKSLSNTIIFVDEQEKFLYSKAFAEAVLNSGCYFVFIVRDALNMLPYSVNEIYYFKNSGYYQNTKQIYNSMHQVYPEMNQSEKITL